MLQARKQAEQIREEKIKQIEQRIAPRGKNEKVRAVGWWASRFQWAVACWGSRIRTGHLRKLGVWCPGLLSSPSKALELVLSPTEGGRSRQQPSASGWADAPGRTGT